jgi:hypothetical protein
MMMCGLCFVRNTSLKKSGIDYIFMGDLISAKIDDHQYLKDGKVDLERLRSRPYFKTGVNRLIEGIEKNLIIVFT